MQSTIRATAGRRRREVLGGTDARGKGEESGGMNMKGKLRSKSLPSAIYDAIVIRHCRVGGCCWPRS